MFCRRAFPYFGKGATFADSFSYSLAGNSSSAYIIVDKNGKIRDFYELAKPFRKKSHSNYQAGYQFRKDAVPGVHKSKPRFKCRHPATTQEKRMGISKREENAVRAEYPDASVHIRRNKRCESLPDLYDDLFRSDGDSRSWKDCKYKTHQWDKNRNNTGIYVMPSRNNYEEELI